MNKAKDFLQSLIREHDMPPKPTLDIDMSEFRTMQSLMILVQDEARAIRSLQEKVPKLKEQRSEAKGIFKGKERKALTEQIQQTEQEIDRRLDKLPEILKGDGNPDMQAFKATYREAEAVVEQNSSSQAERTRQDTDKPSHPQPPENASTPNSHRQQHQQGRQQKPRKKSFDRDSR